MKKKEEATEATPTQGRGKDTKKLSDFKKIFLALKERPKTRAMLEQETDVRVCDVCRYVASLMKEDLCQVHHFGRCERTGEKEVQYLTTDEALFRRNEAQLSFYDILWKGGTN